MNNNLKHPYNYKVKMPKEFINSINNFNEYETYVWHDVLTINHYEDPNKIDFIFPISDLVENKQNHSHVLKTLQKNISGRNIILSPEDAYELTGEKNMKSIFPFSEFKIITKSEAIELGYNEPMVVITINQKLKDILIKTSERKKMYFRGDQDFLKKERGRTKTKFYWFIRKYQAFMGTKKISIDNFKKELQIVGKYTEFKNLKNKVLEPSKKSFIDSWVQFEYEIIKEGRKATELLFYFKKGPNDERNVPYGEKYIFEERLKYVIKADNGLIQKLRRCIEEKSTFDYYLDQKIGSEKHVGVFTEEYIEYTLRVSEAQLKQDVRNGKAVNNPIGYIANAILEGYYIKGYLEHKKKKDLFRNSEIDDNGQLQLIR